VRFSGKVTYKPLLYWALTSTIFIMYHPPHIIVTSADLQDLLFQLYTPLLLLRDFRVEQYLGGIED
jgi:hypothetical protein